MLFLGIISWKGVSRFNGGHPMGGIGFDGGSQKNPGMGGGALSPIQTMGNPVIGL